MSNVKPNCPICNQDTLYDLSSRDHVINNRGKPSKRISWRRLLAKPYVWLAQYKHRGDEIQVAFTKNT